MNKKQVFRLLKDILEQKKRNIAWCAKHKITSHRILEIHKEKQAIEYILERYK